MNNVLNHKSLDVMIREATTELSLSSTHNGSRILKYLLKAIIINPNAICNISRLYEDAARSFGIKKGSVAELISYAIEKSWEDIEPEVARKYFGRYNEDDWPSNKRYLADVSDYIRLKIEE